MARKDDPVFNVKFVELVEKQPCLWNYTHPGYSKKEEVQRAWQHVANEIKDTVRNSRERWRTIRSSFLRSLKLARTQTGRGKRKYYLSKYLQFLIPYTKSRACQKQLPTAAGQQSGQINPNPQMTANGMVLRKPSTSTTTASTFLAALPMTRIGHMRQHQHQLQCAPEEDTKDSNESVVQPSPVPSEEEPPEESPQLHQLDEETSATPLRLQAIKVEQQQQQQQQHTQSNEKIVAAAAQHSLVTLPVTMAAALRHSNLDWTELSELLKCSSGGANNHQLPFHQHLNSGSGGGSSNMLSHQLVAGTPPPATGTPAPATTAASMTATVAAAAAAAAMPPDADYSFLISLHPYLKEMSGKQNRRFRQKVVGLIDNVLDNADN